MSRVYIDYLSACRWWLHPGSEQLLLHSPRRTDKLSGCSYDLDEIILAKRTHLPFCEGPIHISFDDAGKRRQSNDQVVCHCVTHDLPRGSYIQLSGNVYIASPELTLVHMAPKLNFLQLLYLSCAFCALHALDDEGNIIERAQALTTTKELNRIVSKTGGARGVTAARRAFQYSMDNARSPREIKLALRTCLPRMYGGLGAKGATLDYEIPLNDKLFRMVGKRCYRCDLFYHDTQTAVEYQSGEHHVGIEHVTRDAIRRNMLNHLGVRVIDITPNQYKFTLAFETYARQLFRALGRRYRKPTSIQLERAEKLYRELERSWDADL